MSYDLTLSEDYSSLLLKDDTLAPSKQVLMKMVVCSKVTDRLSDVSYLTPCPTDPRCKLLKTDVSGGCKVNFEGGAGWRNWHIFCKPSGVIFPTREGEKISELKLKKVPNFNSYRLSYPGTASTKCIVVFLKPDRGFVVGSKPSLDWAELTMTRFEIHEEIEIHDFMFSFLQSQSDMYVFPFQGGWETALDQFRDAIFPDTQTQASVSVSYLNTPRYFLQMGVRDFLGRTYEKINRFTDLLDLIALYKEKLGRGHVVHLFGTNKDGFDCMSPDFTIDRRLGGRRNMEEFVAQIKEFGLITSHHFNPRIAAREWVLKNSIYKDAVIHNDQGDPWIEWYKRNIYYVMDPGHKPWQSYCVRKVRYFKDIGFDYVELDQIAYQRILTTENNGIGKSYQQLIDRTARLGIGLWTEGVSDVYRLPEGGFFQVLPRVSFKPWDTGENRRGYRFGESFPDFYRRLMPNAPISFQVVTEEGSVNSIPKRLEMARRLRASFYDLELGFVDKHYGQRLRKTLDMITQCDKSLVLSGNE